MKDDDTVVFLGDSIMAAQSYGKTIEIYTLLRYPSCKVLFINAGQGSDTAAGGLARPDKGCVWAECDGADGGLRRRRDRRPQPRRPPPPAAVLNEVRTHPAISSARILELPAAGNLPPWLRW